jgi:hypothetical protein
MSMSAYGVYALTAPSMTGLGGTNMINPFVAGGTGSITDRGAGGPLPTMETRERMERMARLLARECAKKVYVSIYAEGPTRVLCFAEDKASITSVDDSTSVMNLTTR